MTGSRDPFSIKKLSMSDCRFRGTIAVYSCSESCDPDPHSVSNSSQAYTREFVAVYPM